MRNLPAYRKTITAVVGALLTWGAVVVTSDPTSVTASEWLLAAGSLATALGVYGVANEPDPADPDAGYGTLGLLVFIVLVVIVVLWAFGLI